MFLTAIKNWIRDYVKANAHEWVKEILRSLIEKINAHEAQLQKVNVKLANDYSVLSELAGEDYPEKAAAAREFAAEETVVTENEA